MVEDLHGDSEKECLPLAARREVDSNGLITDQTHEPAAADLRDTGDGQKDALLKIVAGLLGLGLDDLKQRHLIARQRRMARIASVSAFLAFSAIALAAYAFYQQSQASIERTNAEIERRATADELAKTQAITNFVQNLFFSLDPEHTARKDTELIKTMLDQGSKRADNELSGEPEIGESGSAQPRPIAPSCSTMRPRRNWTECLNSSSPNWTGICPFAWRP